MRTLRGRLLLGTAVGTTLVLLVSSLVLYALIRKVLLAEFDEALASKARSLSAMIEQEGNELELEFDEAYLPEFMPSDHAEYYQFWRTGDSVFARSRSLEGRDLERVEGANDAPVYRSVILPSGRAGRLVGVTFFPRREDDLAEKRLQMTLVVGRETAGVESTLTQLRWLLVGLHLAAVLVIVVVLTWFVKRGLRPLDRLAAQIANLGEADLAVRIKVTDIPTELLPIVDRLNDLLARLEGAFQRERRFTADVAHELRTPLSGIRSMLEVTLSKQREPDSYKRVMTECVAINQQMQQMIETLLNLARADANQLEIKQDDVDLSKLIRQCWKPLAKEADERQLTLEWRVHEPCRLKTDRSKLQLVLENVLCNAVRYTNRGGQISFEMISKNNQIHLSCANTGSDVSSDDAERVFDRFWRSDTSRRDTGEHCGLGLSLCKQLMSLLGGSISARSTAGGIFTVHIILSNR